MLNLDASAHDPPWPTGDRGGSNRRPIDKERPFVSVPTLLLMSPGVPTTLQTLVQIKTSLENFREVLTRKKTRMYHQKLMEWTNAIVEEAVDGSSEVELELRAGAPHFPVGRTFRRPKFRAVPGTFQRNFQVSLYHNLLASKHPSRCSPCPDGTLPRR